MFLTWATSRATLDLILKIPVPLWGCRGSSRLSGGKPWWSLTQSLDLWMSINSNQSNSNSAKFTAKLNPRQGDEKTMLEMLECALDASFITRPSGRWFSLTKLSRNRVWMSWTEGETWGDATPFCSWFGLELLSSSTTRYKKIASYSIQIQRFWQYWTRKEGDHSETSAWPRCACEVRRASWRPSHSTADCNITVLE